MLAVEKWAEGRIPLIAIFSTQIASTAQDIHKAFAYIKKRKVFSHQFPLPRLPLWFNLYRSHRKPLGFMKTLFSEFSSFSSETIDTIGSLNEEVQQINRGKEIQSLSSFSSEDIETAQAFVRKVHEESFQDLADDFSDAPMSDADRDGFMSLLNEKSLEGSFFFLVSIPCWMLYRESPTRLYRKARTEKGDRFIFVT